MSLRKRPGKEDENEGELLDEQEQQQIIEEFRRRNARDNAFYRVRRLPCNAPMTQACAVVLSSSWPCDC
jgi:hypothetical protein